MQSFCWVGWSLPCNHTRLGKEKMMTKTVPPSAGHRRFWRAFHQSHSQRHMAQSQFSGPFRRNVSSLSEPSNVPLSFLGFTNSNPGSQGTFPHLRHQGEADPFTACQHFSCLVARLDLHSG